LSLQQAAGGFYTNIAWRREIAMKTGKKGRENMTFALPEERGPGEGAY
jgi:hypothetical protein